MTTLPLSITDPNNVPTATQDISAIATAPWNTVSPTTTPTSSSSTPATTPARPSQTPTLTPAQIAGITISGIATAVIVFFLIGSIISCHKRRQRERVTKDRHYESKPRFGALEKRLSVDLEEGSSDSDMPPGDSSNVARAYPKIQDPADIGVAVSSPSDETHIKVSGTSFGEGLVFSTPPRLRVSPPHENPSIPNVQSHSHVMPPAAASLGPTPGQIPPEADPKTYPRKPANVATLPTMNELHRVAQRESTQSTNTIIHDEPMSPAARQSIVRPRTNVEVRDYIPSYYMRSPALPSTIASLHGKQTPSSAQSTLLVKPPLSKFAHPPTCSQDTIQQSAVRTPAVDRESRDMSLKAQLSPRGDDDTPKKLSETRLPAPEIPSENSFGLPANPRSPPRGSPPPRSRDASRSRSITPDASLPSVRDRASPSQRPSEPSTKPKPPPARRTSKKPKQRYSSASVTSFETSGDEQEVKRSDNECKRPKQLSPLPEANGERSPISGLQYPRVPRPANQSTGQRTTSPTRAGHGSRAYHALESKSSSSSLLEKRKGSDAATDIQKALWITSSNGRTGKLTSHGPEYSFQARNRQQPSCTSETHRCAPEMQMKSPLWEPKLTPKRSSDGGLMIEVS